MSQVFFVAVHNMPATYFPAIYQTLESLQFLPEWWNWCVYCCITSSSDSRVMPMRLSVLVKLVSMANEWTPLNSSNFKTTVSYTVFLLEMDESEKVLWFKCNLKGLEDVKAVVLHKHANHTDDLCVLVKLNKEWSMLCAGKMTTEKKTVRWTVVQHTSLNSVNANCLFLLVHIKSQTIMVAQVE